MTIHLTPRGQRSPCCATSSNTTAQHRAFCNCSTIQTMSSGETVTLLFAHGGGFCKETWNPIIRRLRESPLLKSVSAEFQTFDFPYHGSNRDASMVDVMEVDLTNPKAPRVRNPKHDLVEWASEAVASQVAEWKRTHPNNEVGANGRKKHWLIGVGHSMGSTGLWKTEAKFPGTFDGLILFEPVFDPRDPQTEYVLDLYVAVTLQRKASWPSHAAAVEHLSTLRNFARWDREVLTAYIEGALAEEQDGSISLVCHPHIEASLYCQPPLFMDETEWSQPKCPITFHWGDRSKLWFNHAITPMQEKLPEVYKLHEPMKGLSHVMVLENPELSAVRIVEDLRQLAAFQVESSST